MKVFSEQLRAIQNKRGWKQADMARILNMSTSTLSGYMTDKKTPPLGKVAEWAKKLGVSVAWLCGEEISSSTTFPESDIEHFAEWLFLATTNTKISTLTSAEDETPVFLDTEDIAAFNELHNMMGIYYIKSVVQIERITGFDRITKAAIKRAVFSQLLEYEQKSV